MHATVDDLRWVAQAGKNGDPAWYRIHRRLSFPITRALLHAGVSADQVSCLMMVLGVGGAILLAAPSPIANAVGFGLLYLAFLLDKVDGEIARCRGSQSPRGILLDRFHHRLVEPLVFAAAAGHAYRLTESAVVAGAGLVTMVLANVIEEHQQLAPFVAYKHVREGGDLPRRTPRGPGRALRVAARALRPLKAFRFIATVLPMLALCYLADAATGRPVTAWYLVASAVGLAIYLVFQCVHYLSGQLDAEIHAVITTLAPEPPRRDR